MNYLKEKRAKLVLIAAILVFSTLVFIPGCSWFEKKAGGTAEKKEELKPVTCPLCGQVLQDPAVIKRRPVAVKIENDPAARPQSGLNRACLVFEEITEGGITRFMSIYLCRDAEVAGPVRSARPVDIDLVFPYSAIFCHCGGAPVTLSRIKAAGVLDLDEMSGRGGYWRLRQRRAPHNLYGNTATLRQEGTALYPYEGEPEPAFKLMEADDVARMDKERSDMVNKAASGQKGKGDSSEEAPPVVINNAYIPYTPVCAVRYQYDPVNKRFLRYVKGIPHNDLTTGEQLYADTVIIQYVVESASGIRDVRGADTPDLQVVGSGKAQVCVMGMMIDANWKKTVRDSYTEYFDNNGDEIKIKPGSTWIQLVPIQKQVTFD